MFDDESTYSTDLALYKELGLTPWKHQKGHVEFYIGEVKFETGSWIKIRCTCMPAQFYKFEIFDSESQTIYMIGTGSGALSSFWPAVKLFAENMLVVKGMESLPQDVVYVDKAKPGSDITVVQERD